MTHIPDNRRLRKDRNTARFFVENPNIAWVVLAFTVAWGIFGYWKMQKRKDPIIPVPTAAVVCAWPGISAEDIEQRVTKKIEEKLAENPNIERIESTVRTSVNITLVKIDDSVKDRDRVFDDLKDKLDSIDNLPEGAGPIVFHKNFGDTATLMLTVASPKIDDIEISLRAGSVRRAIEEARKPALQGQRRATLVLGFPFSVSSKGIRQSAASLAAWLKESRTADDTQVFERTGFLGIDMQTDADDESLLAAVERFASKEAPRPGIHPELFVPVVIRDLEQTEAKLTAAADPRYSYRELDRYTELLQKILLASPGVGRVTRSGMLQEAVYLYFSQDRLSQYGISLGAVRDALVARNIALPGGIIEIEGQNLTLAPSGALCSEKDLRDVMVKSAARGSSVYLSDLFEVNRDYQDPPRFLNTYTFRDSQNLWQRSRAVTLAVHMRTEEKIADFAREIDRVLDSAKTLLPPDLIIAKTSDQPLQVKESIGLFTHSLLEAVILVVAVAFVGFRQWRSAALVALSIPLTLAMTFGMMHVLGIDLQQTSIASLILALGLLVDDPVVASDAIRREISAGRSLRMAAWLGPTKLANAIVFATIANIAAYLPLLFAVDGSVGYFIYSLPIVLTCALIASRIVSMTFVPLLGAMLLRNNPLGDESPLSSCPAAIYRRISGFALDHRKAVLLGAMVLLAGGVSAFKNLKSGFFPKDLSYYFYVYVWTPEDSALLSTAKAAEQVEGIIQNVAEDFGQKHPDKGGRSREILRSITTFVGGSGPRFWFSVNPELQQLNYAQVIVQTADKQDTRYLVQALQRALSQQMVGANADVRELETGKPVGVPVAVRFSGLEFKKLREIAEQAKGILRKMPGAERIRDDWGAETLSIPIQIDSDRANRSGITNLDAALSSVAATNGRQLTTLREGDKEIPVLLRLQPKNRMGLEELQNLSIFSAEGTGNALLRQTASLGLDMRPEKIRRRNHFRTITVSAFPAEGARASQVLDKVMPALAALERSLPPGYRMEIGGEKEAQIKGFSQVSTAMLISILLIYLALVIEFRNAVKPLIVFSGIPFGVVGARASLWASDSPFGFMAFLGIASLIGVIVSHVVVLFDFIEDAREQGVPLREALLTAGIVRLRPVLITVGATVLGLIPLAMHGGPLWEPLCFAQIGGLTVATAITLLLVPVIYSVFVLDLHIVRWERQKEKGNGDAEND